MKLIEGVINLDKPGGMTSARAVGHVKLLLPRHTRIGHAGTLDPFATGVLLCLIGKATKSCESMMNQPKSYQAVIKLGATTPTDDIDSPENPTPDAKMPTLNQIELALPDFVGKIFQRPPNFSAMKLGGRRAYQLARRGRSFNLAPRQIEIHDIELLNFTWPLLQLQIDCGRGTYIRAIARDLGAALNTGGYLTDLRRTRIGRFSLENAVTLDRLRKEGIQPHLQPIAAIPIPVQ
ncbi:MAG: tRNA pseudouridine(55) synthase TruB [Planctomycetota bacterium]|nr:tRNA pseudouridine(55) synthase TruB [Planctomycetota bacterium]